MQLEKIEFRKCIPQDMDKAVPLIYSSGPDAFSYVFKNHKSSAIDFLRYAFQRRGGEFSYDNHFGVILNDELVGVGSYFDGKRAISFIRKDFITILNFYKRNSLAVMFRGLKTEQILRPPKKNEICIAHLSISPKQRSLGLGRKLISFLMNEANPKSNNYFVLDASEENPRAQSLYERLGFKVIKCEYSKLKNDYGHVANHFRMKYIGSVS
ncbi:MAG: GNAT family N-acetyltransferase [Cyclobacteriaceae bacterium]